MALRAYEPEYPSRDTLFTKVRPWILMRDGHRCPCGAPATQIDHIWPVSRDGSDAQENLRALCQPCNLAKLNTLPGTLPFHLVRPRSPGDMVLHQMARDLADAWYGVWKRLSEASLKHLRDDTTPNDDPWLTKTYNMMNRIRGRWKHWDRVATAHLHRAVVEARQLTWARQLPAKPRATRRA